ncbi:MAG TPA: TonB-dependent receptor [Caulobacteraceae bacterium]|jgi:outer membrane receptor protein involved in Fe transport|nr:TonB-dependent receptor [Caulobacteraceae bacterium]
MRIGLRRRLLASGLIVGAALAAAQAQAQVQAQNQTQAAAATPAGAGEVVVTAQKRLQRLQNVPVSVSAVSGRTLEQMRSIALVDWAPYVAGLQADNVGAPGETKVAIDGIGPIGAASEIGFYVNDTPIGSSSSFQGGNGFSIDLMPYDLNRVEVLRGPQGTLYGASTMGGLIKYVLEEPNLNSFSGRVGGDVFGVQNANAPGGGVRGEVNAPVIDDRLAVRISAYDENTPGYIDDITTGRKHDNAVQQYGGRFAALFQATPDLSIDLSAIYQHTHADNQAIVALNQATGRPFGGPLTNINTRPEPYTQELQLYDATVAWDLHWATLTSISSYQDFRNDTTEDLTDYIGVFLGFFGAAGPGLSDFDERYRLEKFTQEVRLASPTGQRLEWQLGGFYTHERGANTEVFNAYDLTGARLPALNPLEFADLPSIYQEYAIFGDATLHITDRLDLAGGLRYAHNDQSFIESEGGALLNPADPSSPVLTLPGKSSEGVLTFSVSPSFHITPDTMVYARIASGYQPGGPNVVLPGQTAPAQFHSARLTDYQAGVKSTFLDGRATADFSAFYIDWSQIQVSVLVGSGSAIENAGAARSEGFDFNGTYSPIRGLALGGSLAYTDAYLTTPVPSIDVAAGARLPGVPFWSGSLTADYSAPLVADWTGFVGGGYRYVGPRFSEVEGAVANGAPQGLPVKAYNVVDMHVGARAAGWTLTVFARNLLDERAYLSPADYFNDALGGPIDIKAPVLQPRTVGVSIDRSF